MFVVGSGAPLILRYRQQYSGATLNRTAGCISSTVVFGRVAYSEEIVFRRCARHLFQIYLNDGYAMVVVTSILFGAYHWWTGIGNIVEAVLIGVLLMLFLPSISSALAGRACTLPHRYCRLRTMIASKRSPTADY